MLSISEAARAVGVSVPTLRSWERRYGFLSPARTRGGHRRYRPEDIDRLRALAESARWQRARHAAELLTQIDARLA